MYTKNCNDCNYSKDRHYFKAKFIMSKIFEFYTFICLMHVHVCYFYMYMFLRSHDLPFSSTAFSERNVTSQNGCVSCLYPESLVGKRKKWWRGV